VKGIVRVCEVDGLGSPAAVLRSTGTLYIDSSFWQIKPEQRVFILLHELGHARLDTSDEFKADRYASDMFLKLGGSPRQSVLALASVLGREGRFKNGDHEKRTTAQLERAVKFEGKTTMASIIEDFHRNGGGQSQEFLDNISGKDAREQRRQLQLEKKRAQIAKQNARAELTSAKATATAEGTRGGGFKEIAGKVIDGAQNVAAGLLGGGMGGAGGAKLSGSANVDFGDGGAAEAEAAKTKTRNMIIIVVVVVVVLAGAAYFMTRKK